jgi:hypothetical protein
MDIEDNNQRTELADSLDQSADSSGWVTTDVSAGALGVSPRTVRRYIDRGKLQARKIEKGITETWEVSIDSLYRLRSEREPEGQSRRTSSEKSVNLDSMADNIADVLRELAGRLEERAASEAELRTRLELTEKAESTLREERERALADLEREREERRQAKNEAIQLRAELEAERSKGFWRRLFGR